MIGVAKTAFRTATHAMPVLRGRSARPLFVTAAGMPLNDAVGLVRHMAGAFGCPTPCAARMPSPAPVNPQVHRPAGPCIYPTEWSATRGK